MRALNLLTAIAFVAVARMPALAADMMTKGEGMMVMSDGSMATMPRRRFPIKQA